MNIQSALKRFNIPSVILVVSTVFAFSSYAQEPVYDQVFKENIHTAVLFREGSPGSFPLIDMSGTDRLELRFDDFDGGSKMYNYTFEYCDRDWNPSPLQPMQYINGFLQQDITEFEFSFGTKQAYTHYTLKFPQPGMRPKLSGNYILKVYESFDVNNVVLTKRFVVAESLVKIEGRIRDGMSSMARLTSQEPIFTVDASNIPNISPQRDITVMIMQNQRWDNMKTNVKPAFFTGNKMDFSNIDNSLTFKGSNEYRFLDLRSLRLKNDKTISMDEDTDGEIRMKLRKEISRNGLEYTLLQDLNGNMFIANVDGRNGNLDGGYAWVRFSLYHDKAKSDPGDVYIMGQISGNRLNPEWKMDYNYRNQEYFLEKYLKQGYYNWLFVSKTPDSNEGDAELLEGSFQRTENTYFVFVYFRDLMQQGADRLVGVGALNSITDR
ncbi:MAG: DUF5103 domain-containing protein [Flavobacteriales bacterium]|nr:DUF5103 domain-containing protein [Flavobacteriales bacterium]